MLKLDLRVWAALSLFPFLTISAQAQSITPDADGTGTVVVHQGQTYHIQGGTQAGANLFHSFQRFGLNLGEIAQFLSQPGIENILGRVTGGDPSVIHGLLQVTGGSSNLYLINPAGIIFGAGSSLDLPASFTATTADRIGFASGWFNAVGANDYSSLTGSPQQLGFLREQPAAIINGGNLTLTGGELGLYGGAIAHSGQIFAPNVTLAAVPGQNLVRIHQPGMLLNLEIPQGNLADGITALDLPRLLTGGSLQISGAVQGEQVHLAAVEPIQLDPALVKTHGGAYHAPMVTLFGTVGDPVALGFLDITIPDYQTLLYGGRAGTTIIPILPTESGIAKITQTLDQATKPVDEVHILAEGNAGNFWLGRDFISAETLGQYQEQLQSWRANLSAGADLLLYSCFAALGEIGEALITTLANLTGADVAASTNATGSANLGGDWILEASIGSIESEGIIRNEAIQAYQDLLAIFTVTNTNDTGEGSLRRAIFDANNLAGADEVRFAPGITLINIASSLNITGALTINGQGTNVTIQRTGGANFRIFNVSEVVVTTFNYLTIRGGNAGAGQNGGGIYSKGAVTLNNSTVSGNTADFGGGIYSDRAVTLNNSIVSDNLALRFAGGIRSDTTVTLNNSTVSGNSAVEGIGGIRSAGTLTLNDSTVSHNSSQTVGGIRSLVAVILNNSTVSNNSAVESSGGISSDGTVTLNNSTVSNNRAGQNGGGIFSNGAVTVTNNSIVSGNTAVNGFGGGIRSGGAITVTDSTVSNNTAGTYGGGLRSVTTVTLNNSTVSNNRAGIGAGGISSNGAVTLTHSAVSDNRADTWGGGISSNGAVTLTHSTVSGNTAVNGVGGGIRSGGAITVTDSTVSNNTAGNDGGGILSGGAITISNSTIENNIASGSGGGVAALTTADVINSTFNNNTAGDNGGGIYSVQAITLTNSTLSGNTATNDGGGIRSAGGTITNSTIAYNHVINGNGGGIFWTGGTFTIQNSIIANNTDQGGQAPDLGGDWTGSTINYSILGSIAGPTNLTLGDGNIITTDLGLSPLGNYGGPTQTHALLPTSLALNSGNNAVAPTTDQRGADRIVGGTVDIGAYESAGFNLTVVNGNNQTAVTNTAFNQPLQVQVTEAAFNQPLAGIPITFTLPATGPSAVATQVTVLTDAQGIATLNIAANELVGSYGAIAFLNPTLSAEFNLSNILPPPVPPPPTPVNPPPTPQPPTTTTFSTNLAPILHTIDRESVSRSMNIDVTENFFVEAVESTLVNMFTDYLNSGSQTTSMVGRSGAGVSSGTSGDNAAGNDGSQGGTFGGFGSTDEAKERQGSRLANAGSRRGQTMSIAEAKRRLLAAEQATRSRTAVLYAFFRPMGEITIATDGTIRDFDEGLNANRRQLIASALREGDPNDELELVLITAEGALIQRRISTATRAEVLNQVNRLRRGMANSQGNTHLAPAQTLYRWLVAPLEAELQIQGIDHLAFIVDAGLRSLPLAALHDGNGYVIERYSVGLMPSLSLTDLDYRSLEGATVLAMGADTFTDQEALPAVPVELEAIANQLWIGDSLLNADFTIANLMARRNGEPFRIIHLATHGEFQPGTPDHSYIQFWDERLGLNQLRNLGFGDPQVDLLVLSACRSALGDREAEMGFAGLAVAAGAKTALGSLWYVSDAGTLALMSNFYQQLNQTTTKAEALRLAQVAMASGNVQVIGDELVTDTMRLPLPASFSTMEDFSHPYFWSAFTLIGNPW